jgi:hypothetical protein
MSLRQVGGRSLGATCKGAFVTDAAQKKWVAANQRDFAIMRWITQQAAWARRQEQRYGRGTPKRFKRVRPLARIGMNL